MKLMLLQQISVSLWCFQFYSGSSFMNRSMLLINKRYSSRGLIWVTVSQ